MSNTNNRAVIGAFIVGAVALAVVGVILLGGGEFLKKKSFGVMYFDGSVQGLSVGAPVVFRGVKVGAVKQIAVISDPEDWSVQIPVIVEFDDESWGVKDLEKYDADQETLRAVEEGLRAMLTLQSIVTGKMQVALEFMPDKKPRFVGGNIPYPEIPTVASEMDQFAQQFKDLPLKEAIGNFSATILSIKRFVDNPELKEVVHHLNQTILDIQKDVVDSTKQALQRADRMILNLDKNIQPTYDNVNKTVQDIDKLVVEVHQLIKPFVKRLEGTADSIKATSDTARPAVQNVGKAFANIENMTRKGAVERERLDKMLKELSAAARSIKNWASYLERHPEALIRGKAKGNPRQRR
jgi:paraquat-inducible protein B